jgi:signal transduction histidine kinase
MMRLAEFIVAHRDAILVEWESFARSCTPASGPMDVAALSDHAGKMLDVIADDLQKSQGTRTQKDKSLGLFPVGEGETTAAGEHGAARAESGFTIDQMVAEFRALRASVIRIWTLEENDLSGEHLADLVRFNEAIDQALAESVVRFTQGLDESKEMFLAILGHDLRSPLGAVQMSAMFMLDTGELEEPHLTLTRRIASSSKRMEQMVGDLLDFTRSRLGNGIPIVRAPMNVNKAVHDVVDEVLAGDPSRSIAVEARGGESVNWDCSRVSQAIVNLLANAVEHSAAGSVITVKVSGNEADVTITVHNKGTPLTSDQMNGIFGSMKAADDRRKEPSAGPLGNLGLGLYIAERIAHAHGGTIRVESSQEAGTSFALCLPRDRSDAA